MREQDWEWLCEFIFDQMTEEEKARVTVKAEERMDAIVKMVEKNPGAPSTIAECALEYYLENLAEWPQHDHSTHLPQRIAGKDNEMTRICTLCNFDTQSEFHWELHEKSKEHLKNRDNYDRGYAQGESSRADEIARLRELLKKVEFFYSDVTTARFSRGADHDLLEEVRAELGMVKS